MFLFLYKKDIGSKGPYFYVAEVKKSSPLPTLINNSNNNKFNSMSCSKPICLQESLKKSFKTLC